MYIYFVVFIETPNHTCRNDIRYKFLLHQVSIAFSYKQPYE